MRRRRRGVALGFALVLVAALGAGLWVTVGGGGATTPTSALAAPRYVDETSSSGLDHAYSGDSRFFVGGGVAAFDCDDDLRPELYLAGGSASAALYRNASDAGGPLRFERLAEPATDLRDVTGAYPLDLDGDRIIDLAVLRVGENVLLRGLGDCRFERANERWAFDGGDARTMAFSATWEDEDDLPTLAIGDYVELDDIGTPMLPCPDNALIRSDESGERYGSEVALSPGHCPLSMLFSDWDRSGRRDLRVSNDRQYYTDGQEQLWRIEPGAPPVAYGPEDGWVRTQIWGMGIASRDLTGDGYPEVYLTSQGDNKLQTLTGGPAQPTYRDIALRTGVNAPQPVAGGESLPSTAWHPEFADVNNDGFIDLFVTKGNVGQQEGYATRDPSQLLLGGPEGTFRDVTEEAGLLRFDRGRGAAVVDLNLDGLLDVVQVYHDAPVGIWRNAGAGTSEGPAGMGNWIAIRLEQADRVNREAVGAWLEIRIGETVLHEELTVGGGHLGGEAGWIHVGIGPSERADIRVTWPDGTSDAWKTVESGTYVIIGRDAEAPLVVEPTQLEDR